jgi:DNA-binding NarL/FixJ family response regulator
MIKKNVFITVVIADDHEIFRDGFKTMAKKFPEIKVIGEAQDGQELIEVVEKLHPDVVLTDIKMPRMDGIAATKYLVKLNANVIALSMFDEDNLIMDMLEAGAKGYLLKNAAKQEIIQAIDTVHRGKTFYCKDTSEKLLKMIVKSNFNPYAKLKMPQFTQRELEVIRLICDQLSAKEIGVRLNLSTRTIEGHREKILEKMEVHNTAGIVVYAIKAGIYEIK